MKKYNSYGVDTTEKICYGENVGIIQQNKELKKGQMTYQKLFNATLTKIRYATSGALLDNEPLMKAIVKIMYDFSDALKENNLINERTNDDERKKQNTMGVL